MNLWALSHSMKRVEALVDVVRRHAATIDGLAGAIGDVMPLVDGKAYARLESAVRDAQAQLAATDEALSAALRELPEGGE